ncbi:unnamed protein product [Prunus armeniaca]
MDEVPEEIRPKRTKRWMEATPGDNYIPEEVIHDILLRLPSKSLLKCTTVCKSWRSLIRSSAFIHTHLSHAIIKSNNQNDDAQLLLLQSSNATLSLHWDRSPSLVRRPKDNLDLRVRTVKVVETCNGLVCLLHRLTTLIWNTRIRKFVILPQGTVSASQYDPRSYSFGYDSRTDDCKVLRFVRERRVSCAVELCSLARGSWRSVVTPNFVDEMLPSTMFGPVIEPAFVNGAMHWIQDRVDENNSEYCLGFFNGNAQQFNDSGYFHLWVMKEYGVAESWVKLFTISPQEFVARTPPGFTGTKMKLNAMIFEWMAAAAAETTTSWILEWMAAAEATTTSWII